jgi:hypothetical protein
MVAFLVNIAICYNQEFKGGVALELAIDIYLCNYNNFGKCNWNYIQNFTAVLAYCLTTLLPYILARLRSKFDNTFGRSRLGPR